MKKIQLELILDSDINIYFKKDTSDGIFNISNRYSKANNKYSKSYNPKEESKQITYLDVNNLFGQTMSKSFPTTRFKWTNDNTSNT